MRNTSILEQNEVDIMIKEDEYGKSLVDMGTKYVNGGFKDLPDSFIQYKRASLGDTDLIFKIRSGVEIVVGDIVDVNAINTRRTNAIIAASSTGNADVVKLLLDNGADVWAKNTIGSCSICICVKQGKLNVLKVLLNHTPSIIDYKRKSYSLLYLASQNGHVDMVKYLCETKVDMSKCVMGSDPMVVACQNGHLNTVKCLKSYGFDINTVTSNGIPAIFYAFHSKNVYLIRYLIDNNVIIDDKSYNTILGKYMRGVYELDVTKMVVAYKTDYNMKFVVELLTLHKFELVECYIANGLDISTACYKCVSLMSIFISTDDMESVKFLMDNGARLEMRVGDGMLITGNDMLLFLCVNRHKRIMKYVVESKLDINVEINDGMTVLDTLVHNNDRSDMVAYVIDLGADVNHRFTMDSTSNLSPLHIAMMNENIRMIMCLIKHGANVTSVLAFSVTLAIETNSYMILKILIANGADINMLDNGTSPLGICIDNNNIGLLIGLMENGNVNDNIIDGLVRYASNDRHVVNVLLGNNKLLKSDLSQGECIICMEANGENISCRLASCGHVFHNSCVDEWFINGDSCPICRNKNTGYDPEWTDLSKYHVDNYKFE